MFFVRQRRKIRFLIRDMLEKEIGFSTDEVVSELEPLLLHRV